MNNHVNFLACFSSVKIPRRAKALQICVSTHKTTSDLSCDNQLIEAKDR